MHEITEVASFANVLGGDLGGPSPAVAQTASRRWLLKRALQWLSTGPMVSGRHLEVILGHYVAAAMFNRVGLCAMRAVYDFIREAYWFPVRLWASCRYECWIMVSALL